MAEKIPEFTIEVAEKIKLPDAKGESVGTGSSAGDSRFLFTVSQDAFRLGMDKQPSPRISLHNRR